MAAASPNLAALVFDAYGTLYDVTAVAARCAHHFPGNGPAVSGLWRQKQLEYSWLNALMERHPDFWRLTEEGLRFACSALGLPLSDAAAADLIGEYLKLSAYPEVPGALERLSRKLPLAILSNGTRTMLEGVTRHNGLTERFRHILSVDEAGVFKPAPRVYQLAVERLGAPKERIGFVSTNAWDAAGAKSFGLHVIWINRFKRPRERLGYEPDREIHTLDELIPIAGA
jgi:2-haloacid dehalogenase